jgi:lipopolysaccharide transport system ATP-binding protein
MATSMDPDILVIDEALSVGDGAFARKSFDRIMTMKDRGVTILFCSHSTYHVESICSRAIWLDQGQVRMNDEVSRVVAAYNDFITAETAGLPTAEAMAPAQGPAAVPQAATAEASSGLEDDTPPDYMQQQEPFRPGHGRVLSLLATAQGPGGAQSGRELKLHTGQYSLTLAMDFLIDPTLPAPTMIMALYTRAGVLVASAGSHNDGHALQRDARGQGRTVLRLPKLPLLKGEYYINVILACERGLHYYENVMYAVKLDVTQDGLEQGFVTLDHTWS